MSPTHWGTIHFSYATFPTKCKQRPKTGRFAPRIARVWTSGTIMIQMRRATAQGAVEVKFMPIGQMCTFIILRVQWLTRNWFWEKVGASFVVIGHGHLWKEGRKWESDKSAVKMEIHPISVSIIPLNDRLFCHHIITDFTHCKESVVQWGPIGFNTGN